MLPDLPNDDDDPRALLIGSAEWIWGFFQSRPWLVTAVGGGGGGGPCHTSLMPKWSTERWARVAAKFDRAVPNGHQHIASAAAAISSSGHDFMRFFQYVLLLVAEQWPERIAPKPPHEGVQIIVSIMLTALFTGIPPARAGLRPCGGDGGSSSSSSDSESSSDEEPVPAAVVPDVAAAAPLGPLAPTTTTTGRRRRRTSTQQQQQKPAFAPSDWNAVIAYYKQQPSSSSIEDNLAPAVNMATSHVTTYMHPPLTLMTPSPPPPPLWHSSAPPAAAPGPAIAPPAPTVVSAVLAAAPPAATPVSPANMSAELERIKQQAAKQWTAPSGKSSSSVDIGGGKKSNITGTKLPPLLGGAGSGRGGGGARGPAAAAAAKYQTVDVLCQVSDD